MQLLRTGKRDLPGQTPARCGMMTLREDFWIFFEEKVLRVREYLEDRPHAGFELFHGPVLTSDVYFKIVLICNYRVRLPPRRD